ncbi:hypothetical protein [Hymenobacter psychrotolerans]|uniref:Uncharacterized protein n=1 Tax=Hymenobacter psychrotolerans DSM 18569 TaxID=1121959 RepID=A0A1M6WKG9_9BACT|nr:hypothetical protein [Hymenobacter psychrotolerans]SHK94079.1 hypothetical protein SAMN02746009_01821 [Hymenobacter psychrotolerans DSM 18569]
MRLSISTRLVLLCLVALLSALPLAVGFYVNATSPPPTATFLPDRCTRYCEQHGCPHATEANSPAFFRLRPLYVGTIKALSVGGSSLYAAANIALYLVLIPLLLMWLTYGALRNMVLIRRLKSSAHA